MMELVYLFKRYNRSLPRPLPTEEGEEKGDGTVLSPFGEMRRGLLDSLVAQLVRALH